MLDPAKPRSRVFLPAICSGLLLYAAFFPVNAGFLGWVALVPLLSLVRANARPRRIYLAAFVGGLFCYVPAIQWMRVAHPAMYVSWLFLGVYCSLCQTAAVYFVRRLDRVGVPLWLAVPVAWVSVEYFRSHFPSGFAWLEDLGLRNPIGFNWYLLGHTQHDLIPLIQIADVTGVHGLTVLLALMNALLYLLSTHLAPWSRWVRMPGEPLPVPRAARYATGGLILSAVVYGQIRLMHPPFADGPRVALIQGNLPQDVKNLHGDEMRTHFVELADRAVRPPGDEPRPDLVVWPETAYVVPWFAIRPGVERHQMDPAEQKQFNDARLFIAEDLRYWRTPTLLGLNALERETDDGKPWRYNSALLVDARGREVDRYDKMHLVPFGEYVLFGETLPFMSALSPYEADYSCKPGARWTRFPLTVGGRTYHFACIICYEDSDPTLAREYVRPGAEGVDFFVNISNDGWFDGTEEHEQHLAIDRFRAVETRRSIARAVNMGISAIVDPDGRVVVKPGETWAASKQVEAVVRGVVPIDARDSWYARFGDWLPVLCWFVLLGGSVCGWRRRKIQGAAL